MEQSPRSIDMDGLRLIGLGRVPICAGCPRYAELVEVHADPALRGIALSPVPKQCSHAYCAPLARRYGASPARFWDPRRAAS